MQPPLLALGRAVSHLLQASCGSTLSGLDWPLPEFTQKSANIKNAAVFPGNAEFGL